MTVWAYVALALAAGACFAAQPIMNARLADDLGSTLWAAGISAGLTSLVGLSLAWLSGSPAPYAMLQPPWWAWSGGMLGAIALIGTLVSVGRMGASSVIVLVVLGQVVTALVFDSFGVVGKPIPLDAARIIGAVLVLLGATLVVAAR